MQELGIGEAARRAGLAQSAIRYYEAEGLLPAAPRRGGRRYFDDAAVARLQVIRAAREIGFSLDDIRQLLLAFPGGTPPPARWQALARAKLPEIDAAVRRLAALRRMLVAGMRCECVTIEQCFLEDCAGVADATVTIAARRI